jgi:hypothetical protein
MSAYVSVTFEKTALSTSGRVRVIVRYLDQGPVPPAPTATYFPTQPDELNVFGIAEYVNDVSGERWVRVATLADIGSITELPLNTFESATADFVTAGVAAGDVLELTITEPEQWTSIEYPGTNPFSFVVTSVVSATQLTVTPNLPGFLADINWSIPTRTINNNDGVARREGSPAGPVNVRDRRFNAYFPDAVAAENFVSATKAQLDALANEGTGAGLVNENYTGQPL